MKIKCEKCEKDLNKLIDRKFFDFETGQITCPKCQKIQNRYLSASDLYLYLLCSEIYYLLLTTITVTIYKVSNNSPYTALLLFPLLALNIFIQQISGRMIYHNAFFKKEFADFKFKEDSKTISKGIKFRLIVFFSSALMLLTLSEDKIYVLIFVSLSIIETFFRYLSLINKEKSYYKFK